MLIPSSMLGILFALTSAVAWGSGDFSGGLASRRLSPYQALFMAGASSIVVLVVCVLARGETFPSWQGAIFSILAGLSGAFGLAAFYRGLSGGNSAIVAPVAGVVGAVLPVLYTFLIHGMPGPLQTVGFGLAFVGIWTVSQTGHDIHGLNGAAFRLGFLSGAGFGGFFIFLAQVDSQLIFSPLIITRSMTTLVGLAMMRINHLPMPSLRANPIGLVAGALDALGTVLYQFAKFYTRLDIATVLASLYPAITVLLASMVLKEHVSRRQWAGVVLCLAAMTLITI